MTDSIVQISNHPEKRIVFIGPTFPFKGGISKHSTLFFKHLSARHTVEMHTYSSLYPSWLFPGKSEPDPSNMSLRADGAVRDLSFVYPWTFFFLGRRLRLHAVSCVIVTWWTAAWLLHVWLLVKGLGKKLPVIFWCHNVFDHSGFAPAETAIRYLLRHSNYFVVHSEAERKRLESMAGDCEIGVASLPLFNLFKSKSRKISNSSALSELSVKDKPGHRKRILFFGFVRPYKGLEDLLTALPEVLKEVPVELVIAGEFWGKMKSRILRQIEFLGIGDYVEINDGYIPNEELAGLFESIDLVILPYREATGSGIVCLAIEFERPVVVTNVGALPERVIPGKTGWIAEANDPGNLGDVIIKALNAPVQAEALEKWHAAQANGWDKLLNVFSEIITKASAANSPRQKS